MPPPPLTHPFAITPESGRLRKVKLAGAPRTCPSLSPSLIPATLPPHETAARSAPGCAHQAGHLRRPHPGAQLGRLGPPCKAPHAPLPRRTPRHRPGRNPFFLSNSIKLCTRPARALRRARRVPARLSSQCVRVWGEAWKQLRPWDGPRSGPGVPPRPKPEHTLPHLAKDRSSRPRSRYMEGVLGSPGGEPGAPRPGCGRQGAYSPGAGGA